MPPRSQVSQFYDSKNPQRLNATEDFYIAYYNSAVSSASPASATMASTMVSAAGSKNSGRLDTTSSNMGVKNALMVSSCCSACAMDSNSFLYYFQIKTFNIFR